MGETARLEVQNNRWVVSAPIDLSLLILTPVITLPLIAVFFAGGLLDERAFGAWVFAFGAQGHHLPGWLRAYGDKDVFSAYRGRLLFAPPIVVIICVIFAVFEWHSLILLAYLWGVWHAAMQTYGLARIYARKGGDSAPFGLDLAFCLSGFIGAALASELRLQYILDLAFRFGVPVPSEAMVSGLRSGAVAVSFTIGMVWFIAQVQRWRAGRSAHIGRLILIPSSIAFWWFCNLTISHMLIGLALFEIFHDIQYLSLVWFVGRARKSGGHGGAIAAWVYGRGGVSIAIYTVACLAYGALDVAGPAADIWSRVGIGALAASQLLHFYYDGFIWRLQRPEHRSWLNSTVPLSEREKPQRFSGALAVLLLVLGTGWAESVHQSDERARITAIAAAVPGSVIAQYQLAALALQQRLEGCSALLERLPGYDLAQGGLRSAAAEAALLGQLRTPPPGGCARLADDELGRRVNDRAVRAAERQALAEAEALWLSAACVAPRLASVWFNLAALAHAQKRPAAASAYLRRGLALEPGEPEALRLQEQINSVGGSGTPMPSVAPPR